MRADPRDIGIAERSETSSRFAPHALGIRSGLHLLLELDGEMVVSAEVGPGHLRRGIERIAERRRYDESGPLMGWGRPASGIHGALAVACAVERLAGIDVPQRAQWLRSMMAEISRIVSHLWWLGSFGRAIGASALQDLVTRDSEAALQLLRVFPGQATTSGYVRPGGVAADLPGDAAARIETLFSAVEGNLEAYATLVAGVGYTRERVSGTGVIDRATALAYGLTGANLRASGLAYDVRRDRPYAAYDEFALDIPTGARGDVLDRCLVRIEEIRQAIRLVRQCVEGLPAGSVMAELPDPLCPPPGEIYVCVESPSGELGVHLVSGGADTPRRFHCRTPSLFAAHALAGIVRGELLEDVELFAASLDISAEEVYR